MVANNDLYGTSYLIDINTKKVVLLGYGYGKYMSYGKFKGMFEIVDEKRYFSNTKIAEIGSYWIDYLVDSRGNIVSYLNETDCKKRDKYEVFYVREIIAKNDRPRHLHLQQPLDICIKVDR